MEKLLKQARSPLTKPLFVIKWQGLQAMTKMSCVTGCTERGAG